MARVHTFYHSDLCGSQAQSQTCLSYAEMQQSVQSNHLGSASWITNRIGKPVQHIQYLPFGQPYINQRAENYQERFTFTGKEKDEETGYGYFGARYMDHELMTMWLSVDPMSVKYPSISPYAYCAWNPVKLVDPDGRKVKTVNKQSQLNIIHSLSKSEAKYVRFDKNGYLDVKRLNQCKSTSTNIIALRTLAQSKTEYIFSTETRHKDKNNDIDLSTPYNQVANRGVTLMPGNTEDPSPDNNVYVITSSNLSNKDQVENVAHEGYGHAFLYELQQQGYNVNPNHDREQTYIMEYDEEYKSKVITLIWIEKNTQLQQQIDAAVQEARQNYQSWIE